MKGIRRSELKLCEVEILQNCGVCVKKGYDQGAGKRPRQCCPKGPKTKEKATRGPEGPESG